MRRSGTRSPRPCASGTPTPCRSCWHCRSSAGWTATLRGSRARWSGDAQARPAVAVGGRPGAGGGRVARGGRVALREQHDCDAGRGGARAPATADPRPVAGCRAANRARRGGARGDGRPGDGGARPRRAGGARARQRRAVAAAGRSVVLAPALHGRAARSGARAATGAGEPRRASHARPGPVPQGPVDRGGGPVQERRGARSGAHGGVVLPGRGAEPRGRPHRGPHRVRARGRARAGARESAVRLRHRARSAEPPGRRDADVPPLAGGRGQVIRVVVADLAFLASDAIVRPATTRLDPTTPAVRRLEQVGGPEFTGHLRIQKELAVGAAVVTAAGGDLPAEFVIHAVIRGDTGPVTRDGGARAWQSALQRAQEWEVASLTAPPIGTGAGNLAIEDAAEVMVQVLKAHAGNAAFPSHVSIVVETPEDRQAFEAALKRRGAAES